MSNYDRIRMHPRDIQRSPHNPHARPLTPLSMRSSNSAHLRTSRAMHEITDWSSSNSAHLRTPRAMYEITDWRRSIASQRIGISRTGRGPFMQHAHAHTDVERAALLGSHADRWRIDGQAKAAAGVHQPFERCWRLLGSCAHLRADDSAVDRHPGRHEFSGWQ